jgi:hypothetical protein
MNKESRPTAFNVAEQKGDGTPYSQLSTKWTVFDVAKNFIIFRRVLDCPNEKTVDWLIVWVTYKGDIKNTAFELGMKVATLYKKIERLDKLYQSKRKLLAG